MEPVEMSYEQQQLEAEYHGFQKEAEAFFCECRKQIEGAERARKEAKSRIETQNAEIEQLKRKKSAWDLLNGLGVALAWLHNTVEEIPEDVCAKQELRACMQKLYSGFENAGIHPIYALANGEYRDKERYEVMVYQTDERALIGHVKLEKMGFEIEGEGIIKAKYLKYKDKGGTLRGETRAPRSTPSAERYPFRYGTDFTIVHQSNKSYIMVMSDDMKEAFRDMTISKHNYFLLNYYLWEEPMKMRYRDPNSNGTIYECDHFCLMKGEHDNILYLHLYEGPNYTLLHKLPLAELQ